MRMHPTWAHPVVSAPCHPDERPAILMGALNEDYNHPVAVRVNRGGEITEVTAEGTRVTEGAPAGRGVRIDVAFQSEEGFLWTLGIFFHKGQTFVEAVPGGEQLTGPHGELTWPRETIWRD